VLSGTGELPDLARHAPQIESLDAGPVSFQQVEVLQAAFEQPYSLRGPLLPPGLHPTTPPLLIFLAWQAGDSPWGPFAMVQARVSCRSGVRPRGFVAGGIVDNPEAASALSRFGLPGRRGTVRLTRRYDATELFVEREGRVAVHLVGLDPEPLSQPDVQFSVTSTLAETPLGLRLVQVEPEYELQRVERIRPKVLAFDPDLWDQPLLRPRHPVAATVSVGTVTIPRLRYLSRPDVSAFEGTERI
jgi:hypothetical protein